MQKIVIATMFQGEEIIRTCLNTIRLQQNVKIVEHHLISQPESQNDAHKELYEFFNNAPSDCIRFKVDADIVLATEHVLDRMCKSMKGDPLGQCDPPVIDFLSNLTIKAGLTSYGQAVKFSPFDHNLWSDRNVTVTKTNVYDLQFIAGSHARMSDERNAFQYGLRRGLKSQLAIYAAIANANSMEPNRTREIAMKGFDLAQSDMFKDWHMIGSARKNEDAGPICADRSTNEFERLFQEFIVKNVNVPERTWR